MKEFYLDINTIDSSLTISENGTYIFLIDTRTHLKLDKDFEILMSKSEIESNIIFKIVATDNSEVIVKPIMKIDRGQKNTNTYISIKTLMIGNPKKIQVVPSLEIKENRVKAGHGAVVSGINQEELYYLKSKGVDEEKAKEIIIESFIGKN